MSLATLITYSFLILLAAACLALARTIAELWLR